jgi:hypothetical protein
VHVTDFPVVNVHVDELSSAWIWQHSLCATYSANVNINNRLPIKVYYRICTERYLRNVSFTLNYLRNKSWKPECVGSFNMGWQIWVCYPEPELKLKTHSGILQNGVIRTVYSHKVYASCLLKNNFVTI